MTTRVVVVEDEQLFADLLTRGIASDPSMTVTGTHATAESMLAALETEDPTVLVADIDLGAGLTGVDGCLQARRLRPGVGIVLLSNTAIPELLTSLPDQGGVGWSYLLKRSVADTSTLVRAIRGCADGFMVVDPGLMTARRLKGPLAALSVRQREIIELLVQGWSNTEIASRLYLSPRSVENHISRIYATIGIRATDPSVHPRVQAVKWFLEHAH